MDEKTIQVQLEVLEDGAWAPKIVTLNIEEDFVINDANIEGELCQAGRILTKYGLLAAELKAQVARHKEYVEAESSKHALNLRHRASAGEKMTENKIKEEVASNSHIRGVKAGLMRAEADHAKVDNLFRSMMVKSDCLKALAYHQRVELQRM